MKFKDGAIKPGMVIHCQRKEDARALLGHLDSLGYHWISGENLIECSNYSPSNGGTCYTLYGGGGVCYCEFDNELDSEEITEFSDLIEPEPSIEVSVDKDGNYSYLVNGEKLFPLENSSDSPMSAAEVLEWLTRATCEQLEIVFGTNDFNEIFDTLESQKIIDKITAYEAAKNEPKLIELEWVNYCKIIDYQSGECVQETELENGGRKVPTERMLKEYITHHDGDYYATVERRCRVKG